MAECLIDLVNCHHSKRVSDGTTLVLYIIGFLTSDFFSIPRLVLVFLKLSFHRRDCKDFEPI